MKTMTFNEFYEVYTKKLINTKYKEQPLKHEGYRRIYESGDVYEYIVKLKEDATLNWNGHYDMDDFIYTSKLNDKIIKIK
jgi:hypothetical protein